MKEFWPTVLQSIEVFGHSLMQSSLKDRRHHIFLADLITESCPGNAAIKQAQIIIAPSPSLRVGVRFLCLLGFFKHGAIHYGQTAPLRSHLSDVPDFKVNLFGRPLLGGLRHCANTHLTSSSNCEKFCYYSGAHTC